MTKSKYLVLLLMTVGSACYAQEAIDTGALIKEFDKVMAFAVQPYVYYTSTTSFRSGPDDSARVIGEILHSHFYKVDDDLYSGNEQEEMFLQDSLMIRINHSRKSIQMNRVDMATKKRMDLLPLRKMAIQKMLREHYSIAKMPDKGDTGSILIRSRDEGGPVRKAAMEMLLLYTRQLHLPLLMEITLTLPPQGGDTQTEQGAQTVAIQFGTIATTREKALLMPLWKDKINYDDASKTFIGKGSCAGYEVITTF